MKNAWLRVSFVCAVVSVLSASAAFAQTQTVYSDAMVAPWANYSYPCPDPSCPNFSNANPFHNGSPSIAFTAQGYSNGVSFAIPFAQGDTSTATYPVLHFWINGGASGGQQIAFNIGRSDTPDEAEFSLASGLVGDYAAITANTWTEVTIDLTQTALGNNTAFDRIDFLTGDGNDQPVVYIDDITLTQAGAPPAVPPLAFQHDTSAPAAKPLGERMNSDIITWYDSKGDPRQATMAHDTNPKFGVYGVAMREFQYKLSNGATRVAGYTAYGNGGYAGFGYVTDHSSNYDGCAGDDSPLGANTPPASFTPLFEGRHHAIYRYTQNYPRNCPIGIPVVPYRIPVTIDWVFSTGHDSPLWAVTHNVDQIYAASDVAKTPVGANHFRDDTRAPYGELAIDGEGFTDLSGVAWGDYYKFTSDPNATRLTMNTTWNWVNTTTIPFITEWIKSADVNHDAEMGLVQTQTNAQQDAAGARDPDVGSDVRPLWAISSGASASCLGLGTKFPCANDWPYQALGNSLEYEWTNGGNPTHGTNNARLTWKTQYGFIGQSSYILHKTKVDPPTPPPLPTAPGYPKKSYSVYIVLGEHSVNPNPVVDQVDQVDAMQNVTLSTTVGSVVTQGPPGVTREAEVPQYTYQPAGYNHVYGALAFNAATNQLDATINVGGGKTLKKPLIIVSNYTGNTTPVVKFGGVALTADAEFFASKRTSPNELWLTLNRDLSGNGNHLQINTSGGALPTPTNVVATVFFGGQDEVHLTWDPVGGSNSYIVDRMDSLAGGFQQVGTPVLNAYNEDVAHGAAYLYRVRAIAMAGNSDNSTPVIATTVQFTRALAAATIQEDDLNEIREAVDAVHNLADMGDVAWTAPDPMTANTKIFASFLTQVRTKLDEAMGPLGLATGGYTDGTLNSTIKVKAVHLQEIRNRVN